MIANVLGFTAIFLVIIITILTAVRLPEAAKILYVALAVRITVMLLGHYVISLPDSGGDASSFEGYAYALLFPGNTVQPDGYAYALHLPRVGFSEILASYPGPNSGFLIWVISLLYSFTDRSMLMAKSLSLFFGMGIVLLGWLLARKVWDDRSALKTGWILALFPTLILYSCLTVRESYITFFTVLALFGVVNWVKEGSFRSIIIALIGFIGATFFHGAMFLGAVGFLGVVGLNSLMQTFKGPINSAKYLKTLIINLFIVICFGYYVSGKIEVPKLGTFKDTIQIKRILKQTSHSTDGNASYPKWLEIKTTSELIYKAPIRIAYFISSPFPWDVKKPSHLIGLLDALIYVFLTYLIIRNRKNIWSNKVLRMILFILVIYLVLFGISVGNFGTGIRHRSKFIVMFLLLAAPLLPKLDMYMKNKSFKEYLEKK